MAENQGEPVGAPARGNGALPLQRPDRDSIHHAVTFWDRMAGPARPIKAIWRNETGTGACLDPETDR